MQRLSDELFDVQWLKEAIAIFTMRTKHIHLRCTVALITCRRVSMLDPRHQILFPLDLRILLASPVH